MGSIIDEKITKASTPAKKSKPGIARAARRRQYSTPEQYKELQKKAEEEGSAWITTPGPITTPWENSIAPTPGPLGSLDSEKLPEVDMSKLGSHKEDIDDIDKGSIGIFGAFSLKANNNAIWNSSGILTGHAANREYLLSQEVAQELNTYTTFDPFPTYNDLFAPQYDDKNDYQEVTPDNVGSGAPGVRSLFNRAGAVLLGGSQTTTNGVAYEMASEFRLGNNVPLMDNPINRRIIRMRSDCSVKGLVEASESGLLGKNIYSYADFMYCKYLGRISNNYMVTLRRFPIPVDDFISTYGISDTFRASDVVRSKNADSIGCMITWMGTPGNDMANILKYSVAMPFKEQKSQWHDGGVDADSGGGMANSVAALFDSNYRRQYNAGQAGTAVNSLFKAVVPTWPGGDPPYPAKTFNSHRDQTKVYGPVDAIKTTFTRSDEGLDFQQSFQLVFDYELRSYNGINPRQAMLDLLANILVVTYNTGTFWGGGFRGGGAHQNNIFTNLPIFTKGDQGRGFAGYVDSFSESMGVLTKKAQTAITDNGGLWQTLKKALNVLSGMLVSGMLNSFGRPQKAMTNSLLSPAPIGFWHLTIGNPHHPIMSVGNLILKNTTIQHYGPLGIDDFPTGLKITCDLVRGKSRDIRDIEKLYMKGNDRIFSSMDKKLFDMYAHAKQYRDDNKDKNSVGLKSFYVNANQDTAGFPEDLIAKVDEKSGKVKFNTVTITGDYKLEKESSSGKIKSVDHHSIEVGGGTITADNAVTLDKLQETLKKYFGHTDAKAILIPSMEQEYGSGRKAKSGVAGKENGSQDQQDQRSAQIAENKALQDEMDEYYDIYGESYLLDHAALYNEIAAINENNKTNNSSALNTHLKNVLDKQSNSNKGKMNSFSQSVKGNAQAWVNWTNTLKQVK